MNRQARLFVVAPTHGRDALAVSGLATAPPVLGTPALGIVKPATVRQRRRTRRANEGAVVLAPEEIEGDLVDDMIELNWFGEWDRHDRVLVTRRNYGRSARRHRQAATLTTREFSGFPVVYVSGMNRTPIPLRPDYAAAARRDAVATLNTISRAATYLARGSMAALDEATRQRPHDHELHEVIRKGAVVPASTTAVTTFNSTAVRDVAALIPLSAFAAVASRAIGLTLDTPNTSQTVPGLIASANDVAFVAQGAPIPVKQASFSGVTLNSRKAAAIVTARRRYARGPSFRFMAEIAPSPPRI